jgi:hypothetical protein
LELLSKEFFPFTMDEVAFAFRAMGLSASEADAAAEALASEIRSIDPQAGFSMAELGRWLDPIAKVSPNAAARLARYREQWGDPHPSLFWEPADPDPEQ